mgnify:CR=1 FL=1
MLAERRACLDIAIERFEIVIGEGHPSIIPRAACGLGSAGHPQPTADDLAHAAQLSLGLALLAATTAAQPRLQWQALDLLAQAQQMQEKLLSAQNEIAAAEVVGSAGNGLVTVTGNGTGEVTAVSIDPKVVDPDDVETLQDLLLGALADLSEKREQLASEKMGPLAGGLGGGLPGLGG